MQAIININDSDGLKLHPLGRLRLSPQVLEKELRIPKGDSLDEPEMRIISRQSRDQHKTTIDIGRDGHLTNYFHQDNRAAIPGAVILVEPPTIVRGEELVLPSSYLDQDRDGRASMELEFSLRVELSARNIARLLGINPA